MRHAIAAAAVLLCAAGAFGQPVVIDGRFTPGEWDGASTYSMTINLPGGRTTAGKLHLLNDGSNIYIGMRIKEPALSNGPSFAITFDANNDKILNVADDTLVVNAFMIDTCRRGINFYDEYTYEGGDCAPGAACTTVDTDLGATSNGGGTVDNDGTWTSYELWHPMSSGEFADMRSGIGSLIHFGILVTEGTLGSTEVAFTDWPAFPLAEYIAH